MPIIYLSPSTQEKNMYVTGSGSEEYWMNRLADAMIPYLNSCGIRYRRNSPDMTAGSSIRQANSGWYDFYLALHSNAAAEENYGTPYAILTMLEIVVLLSVNLGIMNLLPLPALDGGRLVFMFVEVLRGKPVPPEKEGMVHFVGFVALMILMVFVLYNDIARIFVH